MFGAFHNAASVRIEKEYPLHARRVMHGVWGAGQMSWTKSVFVVDGSVDVHDHLAVLRAMAERCDPVRDIERVRGPIDVLDHATPYCGAGTKLGFDCTPRWAAEAVGGQPVAATPGVGFVGGVSGAGAGLLGGVRALESVLDAVLPSELPGWMFVRVDKDVGEDKPAVGRAVLGALRPVIDQLSGAGSRPPAYVVLVGRGVDVAATEAVLFHWLANTDASRDLEVWRSGAYGVGVFDATAKGAGDAWNGEPVRDWPPVLAMCEEMAARVEARWGEYGLA
jgi:3-polyprenyl-4-hydroxybenzoate decarboxylase